MGTIAINSEVSPDEMPHKAALNQGLHCLQFNKKEIKYFFEIITCNPSLFTMDHPNLTVCGLLETSIGLKRGK